MRFKLELKTLSDAIGIVGKAVATKGVRPILSNLLVVANTETQKLKLVGTDLEIMMISQVEAAVEESGHFTIPAKLLTEIISSIPADGSETVIFEPNPENENQIQIRVGRNKFNLQIQGIEDYPPVPSLEEEELPTCVISTEILAKGIKEAAIAMGAEDGNPVQRSLCMNLEDGQNPVIVATDSKRLAVTTMPGLDVSDKFKQTFIVPSKAIPELVKLMDGHPEIKICIYNEQLVFNSDQFTLITRLIDGRFPDYNRVLPKESSRSLRIGKKDLGKALKSVLPIARLSSMLVHFDISESETRIWAESQEQGLSEVFISSTLQGEPISIAFNVKFVSDFINVIDDEEVVLEMTTQNYPGVPQAR